MIWDFFKKKASSSASKWSPPEGETDEAYLFTPELETAARAGDPVAQTRLATAYHEGLGVDQNPEKAFEFWLAAAMQGHPGSQAMVAASFDIGKVVQKNKIEAFYFAALSMAAGNPLGQALYQTLCAEMNDEERKQAAAKLAKRHP